MPFIRFLRDYEVRACDGAAYSRGDVVECSDDSAEHFTARRAAELCEPPAPKPKATPKAEVKHAAKAKVKQDAETDGETKD